MSVSHARVPIVRLKRLQLTALKASFCRNQNGISPSSRSSNAGFAAATGARVLFAFFGVTDKLMYFAPAFDVWSQDEIQ
jgi:hypothetical protein